MSNFFKKTQFRTKNINGADTLYVTITFESPNDSNNLHSFES